MKGVEILNKAQKEKIKKHLLSRLEKINNQSSITPENLKIKSAIIKTLFNDFNKIV